MTVDTAVTLTVGALIVIGITLFLSIGWYWQGYKCESRWAESGMKSHYSIVNGCMIEVAPGKVIPQDSYREVPN